MIMTCKNCSAELTSAYCPDCGYPAQVQRIGSRYLIHEVGHLLHYERGLFYTIRALLARPGATIRNYLSEDRRRLVKPIVFIIISSLVYTLANGFFKIEEGYVQFQQTDSTSTVALLFSWVQQYYGYANILMAVFIAFWLNLFFRKHSFNLFEILVMLCYIIGMGMLVLASFALIQGLVRIDIMAYAGMAATAYWTWAKGNFYNPKKWLSYVKSISAYLLGMITFFVILILIGKGVEILTI